MIILQYQVPTHRNADVEDDTNVLTLGTTWTDTAGNAHKGAAVNTANFTIDTNTPSISAIANECIFLGRLLKCYRG